MDNTVEVQLTECSRGLHSFKNTNIIEHTLSIAFDNMIIYELMMELRQQGKIYSLCNLFNISDCLVLEDFCFIVVR